MIPMNSSIRKRIKKEEGGIMQIPTKSLLQQPASAPPLRPILPTSHLLFPSLPRLETEGLIILDPEPLLPFPGEPQNLSHYGLYLQDLSAYNATGIKIPQNISLATNSANRMSTSSSAPIFSEANSSAKSSPALSSSASSYSLSALTLTNLKITMSKPLKDKAKLVSEEEKKEKRRAISKRWYERNKDKLKGRIIVLTEEQKVKRRAISKRWYDRNKNKLKGKVVVLTEEQREKKRAKSRLRYQAKKKLIAQQRKAELEEESSMNSSSSCSSTEAATQTSSTSSGSNAESR